MINKYREDVGRKLTFIEVRRFLSGDVATLRRVWDFLGDQGLINYQVGGFSSGCRVTVFRVFLGDQSLINYQVGIGWAGKWGDPGSGVSSLLGELCFGSGVGCWGVWVRCRV